MEMIKIPNNNLPDFSAFSEISKRIEEMMRPVSETLQRINDIMRPIVETIEKYKTQIQASMEVFSEAVQNMEVIERLGNAQFVCWEYKGLDFANQIIATKNINKTLREYLVKEKFSSVNNTILMCKSNSSMQKYLRLFNQAVAAYECGDNNIAVTGFTSVFDGLLADISGNNTHRLPPRISVVLKKLEKDEVLENDEYATLTLAYTFQKTVESFSESAPFDKKEPKGLNRHWIAHGRSCRKRTKLDCIKLINLIYGLLLINELEEKSTIQV